MQRTKLIIFSAFLSPFRSGAEAMVEEVSVRLPDDFDVTIITCRFFRSAKKLDVLGKNVRVLRIGFGCSLDKYVYPFLAPLVARTIGADILHAVLESYAGLALVLCRVLYSKPKRVLTLQSTNTTLLLGLMDRSAHCMTAISNALVKRARQHGQGNVTLIPNGFDSDAIREALQYHQKVSGRILFAGRLELVKGVDVLLHALAKIIPSLPPHIHLRIVGDGSERSRLEALTDTLNLRHRVCFIGKLSPRGVLDEFAAAEIFCGLSRSEAFGNVFIEAQAACCAVLATNVGGIPDSVIHGKTGILVEPDDIQGTADALLSIILNQHLRHSLTQRAQQNVEQYSWDRITAQYVSVLRTLRIK